MTKLQLILLYRLVRFVLLYVSRDGFADAREIANLEVAYFQAYHETPDD